MKKKSIISLMLLMTVGGSLLTGCGAKETPKSKDISTKVSKEDKDVPGIKENVKGKVTDKKIVGGGN